MKENWRFYAEPGRDGFYHQDSLVNKKRTSRFPFFAIVCKDYGAACTADVQQMCSRLTSAKQRQDEGRGAHAHQHLVHRSGSGSAGLWNLTQLFLTPGFPPPSSSFFSSSAFSCLRAEVKGAHFCFSGAGFTYQTAQLVPELYYKSKRLQCWGCSGVNSYTD